MRVVGCWLVSDPALEGPSSAVSKPIYTISLSKEGGKEKTLTGGIFGCKSWLRYSRGRTFQTLSYLPNPDRRPVPPPQTNVVRERVSVEAYVGPGLGGQIRKPGRGY